MTSIRDIDLQKGIDKFNGDIKSFLNMLITFDQITVDDCLTKIYVSIHREKSNFKPTTQEVNNLEQSAKTVQANGLSYICQNFEKDLIQLSGVHDGLFRSLVLLDKFIDKVLEFKDEIKKLSKREYLDNTQIAKGIQHDIRLSILNMNEQSSQIFQSRIQQFSQNFSLHNSYAHQGTQQLLSQSQTVEQQNQNYSYFVNLNKQKEQIYNQVAKNTKSPSPSRVLYNEHSAYQTPGKYQNQAEEYYEEYQGQQGHDNYNNLQKKSVHFKDPPKFIFEDEEKNLEEDCKCNIF